MTELKHECGIAAVYDRNGNDKVVGLMYKLLLNLQNRGQLSTGFTSFNDQRPQIIDTHKDIGGVNEVFRMNKPLRRDRIFKKYAGNKAIGHVRYATCGVEDRSSAQPFERHHGRKWKWFSFCFNGNLANYTELKDQLLDKADYHITQEGDTEIIMHYLAKALSGNEVPDYVQVFKSLSERFDGAYNIAFLNAEGDMIIARDPHGLRPLCYGETDGIFAAASESIALKNIGVDDVKSLKPGHMLIVSKDEIRIEKFAECRRKAHCFFEWIYFSNVASTLDDKSVYVTRSNLGKELAKAETESVSKEDCIVVPVPDTAKPAGDAYAFALDLPSVEGLVRNRYIGRTFIEGSSRDDKVRNKFSALREVLEGKRVFLVDDSIVRGTTMKKLINYIKNVGGAKEVHVRVACPPIIAPCFYGIDMSTVAELFAPNYAERNFDVLHQEVLDKMAKDVGADSLMYNSIEAVPRAIGLDKDELCMACLNQDYPTPYGKKLYAESDKAENKRLYEKGC